MTRAGAWLYATCCVAVVTALLAALALLVHAIQPDPPAGQPASTPSALA